MGVGFHSFFLLGGVVVWWDVFCWPFFLRGVGFCGGFFFFGVAIGLGWGGFLFWEIFFAEVWMDERESLRGACVGRGGFVLIVEMIQRGLCFLLCFRVQVFFINVEGSEVFSFSVSPLRLLIPGNALCLGLSWGGKR